MVVMATNFAGRTRTVGMSARESPVAYDNLHFFADGTLYRPA